MKIIISLRQDLIWLTNKPIIDKANALKAEFESQISQLDNQLKSYQSESVEINNQLVTLSTELGTLESETPELNKQIESLNADLENFINVKADLAMAAAAAVSGNLDDVRKYQN